MTVTIVHILLGYLIAGFTAAVIDFYQYEQMLVENNYFYIPE